MKITVEFDSLDEFVAFGKLGGPVSSPTTGSAPAPSLSPAPQQPANVPLARVLTLPAKAVPGTLRWSAGGATYLAAVVTNGDMIISALYSAPGQGDAVQMTRCELILDNRLDISPPADSQDGLRQWLAERIVPQLNTWAAANRAVMAGAAFAPVSADPIPANWGLFDRAAALLAQEVKFGPQGFAQTIRARVAALES